MRPSGSAREAGGKSLPRFAKPGAAFSLYTIPLWHVLGRALPQTTTATGLSPTARAIRRVVVAGFFAAVPGCSRACRRPSIGGTILDAVVSSRTNEPPSTQEQLRTLTRVTLGMYSHVIGEDRRNAVERVTALLRPIAPKSRRQEEWIQFVSWSGRWESNCIPNPQVLCFDSVAAPFSFKWSQVESSS